MGGFALVVQTTTLVNLSGFDTVINRGNIAGTGSANLIIGTRGDDVIDGGGGNDVLNGWLGNDTLTGSGGKDTFVFNTAPNGSTNHDTLVGFEANARDKIALDPTLFAALLGGTSVVDSGEFRANAGGNAVDGNDFILYDIATGNLYYDADGNGVGAKVLFATLTGVTGTVDYTDFTTALPGGF